MTPAQFEKQIEPRWQKLETLLKEAEQSHPTAAVEELPATFRQVCHDLSVAQHRMSPQRLTQHLNALAIRGYRVLERHSAGGWEAFTHLFLVEFPQAVRAEWKLFWWCSALFYLPALLLIIVTPYHPEWSMAMLGPEGMMQAEMMYGKGSTLAANVRNKFGSDFKMFCFYIMHNIGIDFYTFASGLVAGVGSLIVLLINGLSIGSMAGYIAYAGDPHLFYTFVAGHSAFEITGMVVAGMAGFRLGLSVLKPNRLSRRDALVLAGRKAMPLLVGATIMTFSAAIVEGFWSARELPAAMKYTFGGMCWLLVAAFLLLSGRRQTDAA